MCNLFNLSFLDAVNSSFGRLYPSTRLPESYFTQQISRWFTAIKALRLKQNRGSSSVLASQPIADSANGTMLLASSETSDPSAANDAQDEDWEEEDQLFDDLVLLKF